MPWAIPKKKVGSSRPGAIQTTRRPMKIASSTNEARLTQIQRGPGLRGRNSRSPAVAASVTAGRLDHGSRRPATPTGCTSAGRESWTPVYGSASGLGADWSHAEFLQFEDRRTGHLPGSRCEAWFRGERAADLVSRLWDRAQSGLRQGALFGLR